MIRKRGGGKEGKEEEHPAKVFWLPAGQSKRKERGEGGNRYVKYLHHTFRRKGKRGGGERERKKGEKEKSRKEDLKIRLFFSHIHFAWR